MFLVMGEAGIVDDVDGRREIVRRISPSAALKRGVFLFTHLLMIRIAQTAAYNRFHLMRQQMARWMLMTHDRVNSNEFRITQEFLALMPGVRRVGVSVAMSAALTGALISPDSSHTILKR